MMKIFELIPEVAENDASVLITGETGTGKELVAKAIHAKSPRAHLPFIPINCGSIPDTLLESELFGHQEGAFTGATRASKGFLEVVSGGSLFLDEIGEISKKMQVNLLRALEEKKITRIGGRRPRDIDFRLISATRKNLEEEIEKGRFREDFYYRINVIGIHISPLRERRDDIPLLIQHSLEKYSRETTKQVDRVTPDGIALMQRYPWPGNVRELENVIERAVVLSRSRTLRLEDFAFLQSSPVRDARPRTLRQVEKEYIRETLEVCNWNVSAAARILDINRVTLHNKINRYQFKRKP